MNAVRDDGVGHSVRVVMMDPRDMSGTILLAHQARREGSPQWNGTSYTRPESFGIPGGTKEQGETIEEAGQREALGEAQRDIPIDFFRDDWVWHGPVVRSKRDGPPRYRQDHYFFIPLTGEIKTVPKIGESEKDEILGQKFFCLKDFPLPDDKIPSFRSHIRNLRALLRHLEEVEENRDYDAAEMFREWRYALEKRAGEYIW